MRAVRTVILILLACVLTGCGGEPNFPRDVDGSLERATGGVLRVGAAPNPPHLELSEDGSVSGSEAELIRAYAASIDAMIAWIPGAESHLMRALEDGEVDVVVGGLTSDSPWSTHAALTRAYGTTVASDGTELKLVLATRLGENALLTSVERFLLSTGHRA